MKVRQEKKPNESETESSSLSSSFDSDEDYVIESCNDPYTLEEIVDYLFMCKDFQITKMKISLKNTNVARKPSHATFSRWDIISSN